VALGIQAIIPPDEIIAGGVVVGGETYTVRHNQLSGPAEQKIERLRQNLMEFALQNATNVNDLPADDPEHPDHPDNASLGYNTHDDQHRKPDGSLILERAYYYQKNPSTVFLIHQNTMVEVDLVLENDPTLGGNDRYSLRTYEIPR
jgi:hypothetical protein